MPGNRCLRLPGSNTQHPLLRLITHQNAPSLKKWYRERLTDGIRSEEHTSELQSLMRISYAVFCLKKKNKLLNNVKTTKDSISTIDVSATGDRNNTQNNYR